MYIVEGFLQNDYIRAENGLQHKLKVKEYYFYIYSKHQTGAYWYDLCILYILHTYYYLVLRNALNFNIKKTYRCVNIILSVNRLVNSSIMLMQNATPQKID
jgi:hypothetical protein